MKKTTRHPLRDKPGFFLLFLIISLLLHLMAGYLMQHRQLFPTVETKPEETPITLQERQRWLELDQKPEDKEEKPPENATRLAEENQKVEKETTRMGDDSRDQQESQAVRQQAAQQSPPPRKTPSPPATAKTSQLPSPSLPEDQHGEKQPTAEAKPDQQDIPVNLPSLADLTNLSPNTLARLDRQQKRRVKDRPDIQLKGDEIWLNLQQMDNKLLSFFKRFHDRIEAVWNYPVEASSRGVQGTLLIKIVINKKGELIDALPLESSGSEILDYEAIQAVYRAAPFGALPSYYPHDQLKIYTHFQYSLSRRSIYGQP